MEEFFEEKPGKQKNQVKHIFHLHRRLFLLVLAVAILGQSVLFVSTRLNRYYKELENSFKIIFTVNTKTTNDTLNQIGESLNQKTDITGVRLFSPQDGLEAVRKQNPQLTESLLLR
jgi:cell division protein FtsX